MVVILSDQFEPWLIYICEQFIKINGLKTECKYQTYSEYRSCRFHHREDALIEYSEEQQHPGSLFIPKRNDFITDDYVWLTDRYPIFRNTVHKTIECYDIFYNAFIHLSRLEEWESEKKKNNVYSYSSLHPRKIKAIWKIPIVNLLFNDLENKIKSKFPGVLFSEKNIPVIEYSHDVDYIEKTIQLRLKQTLFHLYNAGKSVAQVNFRMAFSKFLQGIHFSYRDASYWCFDGWNEMERSFNIKSVYYFYARTHHSRIHPVRKWAIDPSYDVARNDPLKAKCAELLSIGHRIGIHGSYFSAQDEILFLEEKYILEKSFHCTISKSRQHWLNYREASTPYIHSRAGIEVDSSIGFNDIPGFRAGVASKYNPYDHINQVPFAFEEIPMVVMDSHIHDYSDNANLDHFDWFFDCMNEVKNFAISIDWHQRGISLDYGWVNSYMQMIEKHRDQIRQNES